MTVRATEVSLEGRTPDNRFFSGIFANAQEKGKERGMRGMIVVEAQQVSLSEGAQIGSSTFGPERAGR